MSLEPKLRSWQFPRYWWFNKWYYGSYQLICLISWPILIALRRDWYQLKDLFKGFWVLLRPWESLKNWWRYGQMKFVTAIQNPLPLKDKFLLPELHFSMPTNLQSAPPIASRWIDEHLCSGDSLGLDSLCLCISNILWGRPEQSTPGDSSV